MSDLALRGGKAVRAQAFFAWPEVCESDKEALERVLRSGKWGRHLGTEVSEFEAEFAALIDAEVCVGISNGTVALEIALRAMDIGIGDEVIVPDYTFVATASAVLMVGAVPVFTDIDPLTYCIDPAKIEPNITPRTRAIIPVHFAGGVAKLDAIMAIAERHQLQIIEDACQAHLAEWNGKKVGTIAELGCFSFQASKNINSGEGGAIVGKAGRLMDRCYSIHTCGRDRDGVWYHHPHVGTNARLTEFQGALLRSQMQRAEEQARRRAQNADFLTEHLNAIDGIQVLGKYPQTTRHAHHLLVFRIQDQALDGLSRDRFIEALRAEGVPCQAGYVPLHRESFYQEAFASRAYRKVYGKEYLAGFAARIDCPNSCQASDRESVWLGQSLLLGSRQDMQDIVAAVEKVITHRDELI